MYKVETLEEVFSLWEKEQNSVLAMDAVIATLRMLWETYQCSGLCENIGEETMKKIRLKIQRFSCIYSLILHEDFINEFCEWVRYTDEKIVSDWVLSVCGNDDNFKKVILNKDELITASKAVMNDIGIYGRALRYEMWGMRFRVKLLMEFHRYRKAV